MVVLTSIFFIKNLSADINKEVSDLKNEFKQIKEIYENKIEALEAKIEKLENEKAKQDTKVADHHDGHSEESSFNIEAVLNGKYTSFTRSGEVEPKGFGTAHEGERGREGLYIGESELIINSDSPMYKPSLPLSPSCAVPKPLGSTSPLLVKEVYFPFNTASILKLLSSECPSCPS